MFWFDNIFLALASVMIAKKTEDTYYKNKVLKSIMILIIILLNVIVVKEKNEVYKSKGYNKSLIVQGASIYYYHYEDAKDYFSSLFGKGEIDEQRLNEIYEENLSEKPAKTEYTGIAENCNVIILQLESVNEYVIGKTVNGK